MFSFFKQTQLVDLDSEDEDKLEYGEIRVMIGRNDVHDEEELIRVNEYHEVKYSCIPINCINNLFNDDHLQQVWIKLY